ncbi:hypothetical protein [Leucobacter sp. G161]|uniref:hypothetical protein n=1 Tax=Leucobacter sp. G161 TaxID=663704 RepID=UPI00073BFC7A|nr:hypothetical protein [Leucobacter sp. G161]KUF07137.1 hypothetical protein AUL38_02245 [Leucobacter sp. G161]
MQRLLAAGTLAVITGLALAGCAADPTGTVTLQVSEFADDYDSDSVEVALSIGGEEFASVELREGDGRAIEDVPLGWLKIDALDYCSGEAELSATSPTMGLLISGDGSCAFTD